MELRNTHCSTVGLCDSFSSDLTPYSLLPTGRFQLPVEFRILKIEKELQQNN